MNRLKIAILDDWEHWLGADPLIEELKAFAEVTIYDDKPSREELLARVRDPDVIIPIRERTRFTAEVLGQMKKVKLIAQTGSGVAHIDMKEASRLNIPVAITTGGSDSVVELTFAFILACARNLPGLDQDMKRGIWSNAVGVGLKNKTIGIIGLGRIGKGVARVAKAFRMHVLAWGPTLTEERAQDEGVQYVSLEQLMEQSHFVTVHVRLTPQTEGIIRREHFRLMRPDAFFINTSRGNVIDEEALVEVLQQGRIAGAGLDVFQMEPLPEQSPFLNLKNCILTPHIGWKTDTAFHQFLKESIENIRSFCLQGIPKNIKNLNELSL